MVILTSVQGNLSASKQEKETGLTLMEAVDLVAQKIKQARESGYRDNHKGGLVLDDITLTVYVTGE